MLQEMLGLANIRGIHPMYKENQTFEIFMPKGMIEDYRNHYMMKVNLKIVEQ